MKKGYCLQKQPRFYYSPDANKCLPFIFSGCGGNENRFRTKEICEGFCSKTIVKMENETSITTRASRRTNEPTTRIIYITKSSQKM
ncbi:uncharacterized protein DC041_0002563 [Schistosoma bovis]|uniref:BPTI/Kunitz inhibitor domain-containing protein n=1 Tax=Schistosoma bovis TaxID=6184 RepID=A0A430QIT7_SCHBO|nr:uncharacterized protein DC041_0002563 [Schistosoma bovis]